MEHLGISYPPCAFPLHSTEILRAVKLCHLCDLQDGFGEGVCDNSATVVWLKMVSCEAEPSAYKFQERRRKRKPKKPKKLTSKQDASLDSPGNHKITPLKTA